MLLPFTEISDARNRRVGNPELKPEFGNSYEAGYLRHWEGGSVLASVYYRYRTDVIERVSEIDNAGITTTRPINLAEEESWGIEFSGDQEIVENRSEEHTSELQSRGHLVCRLLLAKKT